MKRKAFIFIIFVLIFTLAACNIKPEDFNGYFEGSIASAKGENYYSGFELTRYTAKESTGITGSVEYSVTKIAYTVAHRDGEYYCKTETEGVVTQRWVYKEGDELKLLVKENGEVTQDRLFTEEDSINIIADLLQYYSTLSDKDILQRQGIKRAGFDMLKVRSEQIESTETPYRKKIGKGDDEYKYYWDKIKCAEKRTVNLTIKKGKLNLLEAVIEYAEPRETPSGQITTTDKYIGVVIRREQIEARINYGDFEIPAR
ncbi:MAG: hypothetical protein ACOYIQ_00775 [Christensenellales bacterium]|jgi:hypothetical protein